MSGTNPFANLSPSVSAQLSQAIASGSQSAVTDLFASLNYSENQSRTLLAALGFVESTIPAPGAPGGLETAYGPNTDGTSIITIERILLWIQKNHPETTMEDIDRAQPIPPGPDDMPVEIIGNGPHECALFKFTCATNVQTADSSTYILATSVLYWRAFPWNRYFSEGDAGEQGGMLSWPFWTDLLVVKLTPSGRIDENFGFRGAAIIVILPSRTEPTPAYPLLGSGVNPSALNIQASNGKVLVGGYQWRRMPPDSAPPIQDPPGGGIAISTGPIVSSSKIWRFNANGTLDTTWGYNPKGSVTMDWGVFTGIYPGNPSSPFAPTPATVFTWIYNILNFTVNGKNFIFVTGTSGPKPFPGYPVVAHEVCLTIAKLDDSGAYVQDFNNGSSVAPGFPSQPGICKYLYHNFDLLWGGYGVSFGASGDDGKAPSYNPSLRTVITPARNNEEACIFMSGTSGTWPHFYSTRDNITVVLKINPHTGFLDTTWGGNTVYAGWYDIGSDPHPGPPPAGLYLSQPGWFMMPTAPTPPPTSPNNNYMVYFSEVCLPQFINALPNGKLLVFGSKKNFENFDSGGPPPFYSYPTPNQYGSQEIRVARITKDGNLDTDPITGFGPFTAGPGSPRQGWKPITFTAEGNNVYNVMTCALTNKRGSMILGGYATRYLWPEFIYNTVPGPPLIEGNNLPCTIKVNQEGIVDTTWGTIEGEITSGIKVEGLNIEGSIFLWKPTGPYWRFIHPFSLDRTPGGIPNPYSQGNSLSVLAETANGKLIFGNGRIVFMNNG